DVRSSGYAAISEYHLLSKSIRFWPTSLRSPEYVCNNHIAEYPEATWLIFHQRLKRSWIETFMPWPAFAEWVWHASPVTKIRGFFCASWPSSTSSNLSVTR